MADFQRNSFLFDYTGFNLANPIDRLPEKRARLLYNTRRYGTNRVQSRQGIQPESTNAPVVNNVHSIFSWNDPIPDPTAFPGSFQAHSRMMGISTSLTFAAAATPPGFFVVIDTGYSGNPMTFVVAGSDFSPRPWAFVGDFNKTRKCSSADTNWHMGVAPPNFAPTAAINAPLTGGPDIGTTNLPYVYRFRARCDTQVNTGAVSNLGPPIRDVNGLSPSSAAGSGTPPSSITVTVPSAHPDPQVRWLDVYRYGGSLPVWTYIGTIGNVAGFTLIDIFADLDIASNPVAEFNDNQPWLSVDTSKVGTCNVTAPGPGLGGVLTVTAGDTLRAYDAVGDNPFYPLGNQIAINGTNYTFYASPTSTTTVELLEDPPAAITGGQFVMTTPEIMHQPLPCMWGPFGGGLTGIFVFACGDALRPGAIYWTKGNNPESHPGANVLDITSASEPLMNGVLYNGNPFVFSTNRMFALYPTLGQVSDFSALEIPNSRGLFARWGLCVTPWGMAFIAKDGIYLTAGGSPTSLTDEDLYPFFPHESSGLEDGEAHFPFIDGIDDSPISRPDFKQPDKMRLEYGDGFLYFNYIDQSGHYRTMVGNFDVPSGRFVGWISRDTYTPEVTCRYFETVEDTTTPNISSTRMLLGVTTGFLATYGETTFGVDTDFGNPIDGHIRTGSQDTGDPRPRKLWGDVEIDLDSKCNEIDIRVGFDNFSSLSSLATGSTSFTGRHRILGDINSGRGQYAYNMGLYIIWTSSAGQPIFYTWTPTWVPKPELTALRVTDWTDCGYMGAKFIQGFKLRADTLNVVRNVLVLDDTNTAHAFTPTTVLHNGEQTIAYSFNTPFISHLVRFAPTDANFWRIEGIEWLWNVAPELVTTYTTQETTHDLQGFFHHRDAYIACVSTAAVNWNVIVNGNPASPFTYTIPSTAGQYLKNYIVTQPMKALECSYSLTSSAGFRLFELDSEVRVKQWGSQGPYVVKMPFGDYSRNTKAKI